MSINEIILSDDGMQCTEADKSELDAIVNIHLGSLPNDVFASMGFRFLKEFYENCLHCDERYLIVAKEGDIVVGFCLFMYATDSIVNIIPARGYFSVGRLLFVKPKVFISAVLQFLRLSSIKSSQSAEISFIAVDPGFQGKGRGKQLVSHATDMCRIRGLAAMHTKTSNQRFAQFYRREFNAREIESFNILGSKYSVLEWSCGKCSKNPTTSDIDWNRH